MLKRLTIITLLILGSTSAAQASSPIIRVQISENASKLPIYARELIANELGTTTIASSQLILRDRVTVTAGNKDLLIDGKNTGWEKMKFSSRDGLVWVDGKSYSGDITIEKNGRQAMSAVNTLPLENYITGTLAGEMPQEWPLEALKAQAVTARTYALYVTRERRMENRAAPFDIKSTVEDQVYKGAPHTNDKITEAIKSTEGEILTYHDKPLKTRFHSTCGGQTETSIHVWGEEDVSKNVIDPYCKNSPYSDWKVTLSSDEISGALAKYGLTPGKIVAIKTEKHDGSRRVAAVSVEGSGQTISLNGNDFRRYIGFGKIKSTFFDVAQRGSQFVFSGRGFGHGVGMCQWGAKGMAEKKNTYKDILQFYYPGAEIKKIY